MTYLLDWAQLLARWLHLIAGIAWIGASFYFVWLDNHLKPPERDDPGVAGELWAVHGGGFYRSAKYRVAPQSLPSTLYWFYWEAYTTWLSGFALLCLLYFVHAEAYLVDPAVAALTKPAAIGLALTALLAGWLVYDGLCRSTLGRHTRLLGVTIAVFLAGLAFGLCRVYSGRGAFMVFGSTLGTIMVANVFFVIIPGQRQLVRAKREGRDPDPALGTKGKQRSVHNTYFTLPVLFVMISNHYAMTQGAQRNWLVLIAMSLAAACIRAWFVARHKLQGRRGLRPWLPAALGISTLVAVVIALSPVQPQFSAAVGARHPAVDMADVQQIVGQRCVPCHAAKPTEPGFSAAPNGIMLESPTQLRAYLPLIQRQLAARTMPLGNLTGMTDAERATLLAWANGGQ